MPTGDTGMWRNALWSAKAAITLESLRGSQDFLKGAPGTGMPSFAQIFSSLVVDRFRKYYVDQDKKDLCFFEDSFSKGMRRIPIKPETKEALQADLDRKFVPLGIVGQNIGSNAGLIKILMDLRVEEESKPHVPAILVDCNIYWRIMKVIFLVISLTLACLLVHFAFLFPVHLHYFLLFFF